MRARNLLESKVTNGGITFDILDIKISGIIPGLLGIFDIKPRADAP